MKRQERINATVEAEFDSLLESYLVNVNARLPKNKEDSFTKLARGASTTIQPLEDWYKLYDETYDRDQSNQNLKLAWNDIVKASGSLEELGMRVFAIQFKTYESDLGFHKDFRGIPLIKLLKMRDFRKFAYYYAAPIENAVYSFQNKRRFHNIAFVFGKELASEGVDSMSVTDQKNFAYRFILSFYSYVRQLLPGYKSIVLSPLTVPPHNSVGQRTSGGMKRRTLTASQSRSNGSIFGKGFGRGKDKGTANKTRLGQFSKSANPDRISSVTNRNVSMGNEPTTLLTYITADNVDEILSDFQIFFKLFGIAFIRGFCSLRPLHTAEQEVLKQTFQKLLDQKGMKGLGWEIMDEYFKKRPMARNCFESDQKTISDKRSDDGVAITAPKSDTTKKTPIGLETHVIFYVNILYRCICELDDIKATIFVLESFGFEHAAVDIHKTDYALFWKISLDTILRHVPSNAAPAYKKFFVFLESRFSIGLAEARAETKIIKKCRLDMAQISVLQNSWSKLLLRVGEAEISRTIYKDFLINHPEYQQFFVIGPVIGKLQPEIVNVKVARKHASLVVHCLTIYIGNLHRLSEVNKDLKELGADHAANYHITEEVVEEFISSIATSVCDLLWKEGLFDDESNAWKRFFFMILTFLCEGVKSFYDNPNAVASSKGSTMYGLTHNQTDIIISNFTHLLNSPGPVELGMAILTRWQRNDPKIVEKHFPGTEIPHGDSGGSDMFLKLATEIADSLHIIIFNLYAIHAKEIVKEIGYNHGQSSQVINKNEIRLFSLSCYQAIRDLMTKSGFNSEADEAWKEFLDKTCNYFNEGLQMAHDNLMFGHNIKTRRTKSLRFKFQENRVEDIQLSWAMISQFPGLDKIGTELFLTCFEKRPDLKEFYKNLRGKTPDQICRKPYFEILKTKYVSEIGIIAQNCGNPEFLAIRLEALGSFHAKMGVETRDLLYMFFVIDFVIMDSFAKANIAEEIKQSWKKLLTILNAFMLVGFDSYISVTSKREEYINLDEIQKKIVKKSLRQVMSIYEPKTMSKKFMEKVQSDETSTKQKYYTTGTMEPAIQAMFTTMLVFHRVKEDVSRMCRGENFWPTMSSRAKRTFGNLTEITKINAQMRIFFAEALKDKWKPEHEEAWEKFFSEIERILGAALIDNLTS